MDFDPSPDQVVSKKLLKFDNNKPLLDDAGIEMIRSLPGKICPIILIGDGRAGKSYLASRVLNTTAFLSSDSMDAVTEGIDIVSMPVGPLLATCEDLAEGVAPASEGEHLLVLDCEGGNNAMAAIRTLVNVFGIVLGTEVIFVAGGMASEASLQNLGATLAARSLIKLDGDSSYTAQKLIFVVNKNTLKYQGSVLDKMLESETQKDPSRKELRETISSAFPDRSFFAVPMMGMPDFESSIKEFRAKVLSNRRPFDMAGAPVTGPQMAGLLEFVVKEIENMKEISFPSMSRHVIYDGFLLPLTADITEEMKAGLPALDDYDPKLLSKDPRPPFLKSYDDKSSHIGQKALVEEAKNVLENLLAAAWGDLVRTNDKFGEEVKEIVTENREVESERFKELINGRGLLRKCVVTRLIMTVESRAVIHRKRGGEPERSEWTGSGSTMKKTEQDAFDMIPQLQVLKGHLWKRSPNMLRSMLKVVNGQRQQRICMLKDGHFLWWQDNDMKADAKEGPEAKGCINFLLHRAEVVADESYETIFTIRPKTEWQHSNVTFSGGADRSFHFDCEDCETSRDEWIKAISKHIVFGNLVFTQMGEETIVRQVGLFKPTLQQVE